MRIVVDTNVLISGLFFGDYPCKILKTIVENRMIACVTLEIVDEYEEIVQEMFDRKQGHINHELLNPLLEKFEVLQPLTFVKISRDPDDDKFLGCAKDAKALYVISGDKDLLSLENYEDIKIVTAKDFCEHYLL